MCRSCARIRLAALVPPPRVHLTRFHGVFAAHAALRAAITPGGRGAGARKRAVAPEWPTPKDIRMNWARRVKRVFGIEIEPFARCGGRLKVVASIEEPPIRRRDLPAALTQSALRASAASAVGPFKISIRIRMVDCLGWVFAQWPRGGVFDSSDSTIDQLHEPVPRLASKLRAAGCARCKYAGL